MHEVAWGRVATEGGQEGLQISQLLWAEVQRLQYIFGVMMPTGLGLKGVVEGQYIPDGLKSTIVHVWTGAGHISQGRCSKGTPVLGPNPGIGGAAGLAALRGITPRAIGPEWAGLKLGIPRPATWVVAWASIGCRKPEIVKLQVRHQWSKVALAATCLSNKELKASDGRIGHD